MNAELLQVLHCDPQLSTRTELFQAKQIIERAQRLSGGEIDTIKAAFLYGPLYDGDIPSKQSRDTLVEEGYMARVIHRQEEGFNALTNKGGRLYRLIQAGAAKGVPK